MDFLDFTYEALLAHQNNLSGRQILLAYLVLAQMQAEDIVLQKRVFFDVTYKRHVFGL